MWLYRFSFFFNDTATTEISTLSLHDALPIYLGDDPAGFVLFFHSFSTFLGRPGIYLEDLYVRPEFRGNGIGRAMLVYLAGLAKERDCGRLEWSVLDWNEPAIRLYRGIGAVSMDDWTVYRVAGEDLDELAARA